VSFINKVKAKLIIFMKKIIHILYLLIQKIKSTRIFKKIKSLIDMIIIKLKPILHKLYITLIPKRIREDNTSKSKILGLLLFSVYFLIVQFLLVYGTIFIVVKSGGKSFTLPNVEGVDMFTAFNILQKEGMTLQIESHIFPDHKLGTVIVQEPKGGTKVKRGRSVSLVVNMTPSSVVFMPDLTGKDYNEAMEIITNEIMIIVSDLKILDYISSYKKNVDDNTVVSQIPLIGEPVTLNSEIILTVNEVEAGYTVQLKNLVGTDAFSSVKELEKMGIFVNVESIDVTNVVMYGKVVEQSINEGKYTIKKLQGITLTVANDLDNDTKIRTFRYNVPNDRVEDTIMSITLDDNNDRTTLFNNQVRAAENIKLNYSLKGTGVITVFFNDTPFETITVE